MDKKRGLGRGLSALISESNPSEEISMLSCKEIKPNASQPRKSIDQHALAELAESIQTYGIIQPLLVQKKANKEYEIIAGERRWRAAQLAGLTIIPCIVKKYEKAEAYKIALIENLQRENLNPIEEALGFQKLMTEFHLNHEEIAKQIGKNRSTISNRLRILNLDARVQNFISEQKLSAGHGRALLATTDPNLQFELAERIMEEHLSVRQTEQIMRKRSEKQAATKQKEIPMHIRLLEKQLQTMLDTPVKIKSNQKKGTIAISFRSEEELQLLLTKLQCFVHAN